MLPVLQQLPALPANPSTGVYVVFAGLVLASLAGHIIQLLVGFRWRGAAEAWKIEIEAVRERAERTEQENRKLHGEIATLQSRTDLTRLEKQIAAAVERTSERHAAVLSGLSQLARTVRDHDRVLGEISTQMASSARALQDVCSRLESLKLAA